MARVFLVFGIAVCTKGMRLLAVIHSLIKRAGVVSRSEFVHRAAFRLTGDVFRLHTFLFGCAGAMQSHRDRLMGFDDLALRTDGIVRDVLDSCRDLSLIGRMMA